VARSGSFGSSLNPFGTGTFGGFAQYDIGDSLKDLEAYRLEIAWGNGTITDEEYAASLAKLVAAATPGSQARMSAQNKLDDVTYRIGRSKAEAQGPDALIAFDQQTLATMNPSNVRYREIADSIAARIKSVAASLAAELADRRARDYAAIMDAYGHGQTSTESVLAWVENTLSTVAGDAPDRDNWESIADNLLERLVSEKDAQVYQDYQDGTMLPADFVAYLTGRRDAYDPSSPKWVEADRRLKDAEENVKDAAFAKADQEFFNLYEQGKKSDDDYLLYVSRRIDGMDPDDPALPEWKQKLTMAAHSFAEDKLRHEVNIATAGSTARSTKARKDLGPTAAETTARKNLLAFYVAYSKTLNPGSSEARATEEQIVSLRGTISTVRTGTGGTGGGGGTVVRGGGVVVKGDKNDPKVILNTASFDAALRLLTPNAGAPKKDQAIAVAALRLNLQSAEAAKNDKVWLFTDPRYPGQTVAERDADGVLVKDSKGKQSYVPGSSYRATSSDEIAGMQMATANYSYGLAGVAAAKGDVKGYWTSIWHANVALDAVRTTQAHAVQVNITAKLKAIDQGIEVYTKLNDPASVINLLMMKADEINRAIGDSTLDDAQREKWETKGEALEKNPLFPGLLDDMHGDPVWSADGKRIQDSGLVDLANSTWSADGKSIIGAALTPGTHFVLDSDESGDAKWRYVWEDPALAPIWAANHVTVQTGAFGQRVTGEVEVKRAPTVGIRVTLTDGSKRLIPFADVAEYVSYRDGDGNLVRAYSIDGRQTWMQTTGGLVPMLELKGTVTWKEEADGSVTIKDAAGRVLFASPNGLTGWVEGEKTDGTTAYGAAFGLGAVNWFGQDAATSRGDTSAGVGYPGQQFRLVNGILDPSGQVTLNFVPNEILVAEDRRYTQAMLMRLQRTGTGPDEAKRAAERAYAAGPRKVNAATGFTTGPDEAWRAAVTLPAGPDEAKRAAERAYAAGPVPNAATGFTTGPDEAWRAAGTFASSLVSAVPQAVAGIIAVGSAIVSSVVPPTWLPPYVAPSSLTPPQPYVPPSSLTYTPVPVPTLQPPRVTPPYVAPSSLTQPPRVTPPYVAPSSLTQPPRPTPTPPPTPRPVPTPTTTPGVTRPGGLPTGPQR